MDGQRRELEGDHSPPRSSTVRRGGSETIKGGNGGRRHARELDDDEFWFFLPSCTRTARVERSKAKSAGWKNRTNASHWIVFNSRTSVTVAIFVCAAFFLCAEEFPMESTTYDAAKVSGEARDWCTWDENEITTLITVWSAPDIQLALHTAKHNSRVFETIASRLSNLNIFRTPQQCRNKIKKLKCEWRKVTEEDLALNKKKVGCKFYKLMASVMINSADPETENGESNRANIDSESIAPFDDDYSPSMDDHISNDPSYLEVKLDEQSLSGDYDAEDQNSVPEVVQCYLKGKRHLDVVSGSCSDDNHSHVVSPTSRRKRRRADMLDTMMSTFLEAMRKERQSMREELAKFEERRIQLENEAELRKIQLEHEHELKMASLLGQITTQIIECLTKKE